MPRLELKDQSDIIHSIREEGGYARKWATHFQVGVPDLVCAHPGVGNFLLEVKSVEIVDSVSADEKLKVTPKQLHELEKYSDAGGLSLLGIVAHRARPQSKVLYIAPWFIRSLAERLTLYASIDGSPWDANTHKYEYMGVQLNKFKGGTPWRK